MNKKANAQHKSYKYLIFSDGACSGNPGPGGWGAILCNQTTDQVKEMGGGSPSTTNNQMEMLAIIQSLKVIYDNSEVVVYTDSVYLIKGISEWIHGWKKRGWKNSQGEEVLNQDLWRELDQTIRSKELTITWKWVRGHSGVPANERCDEIAVAYSQNQRIYLYQGELSNYGVHLFPLPPDKPLPDISNSFNKEKKPAFSYLSLVNGVVTRHKSWAECEKMVKGRPGVKFKKSQSQDDEKEILKSWGLSPERTTIHES